MLPVPLCRNRTLGAWNAKPEAYDIKQQRRKRKMKSFRAIHFSFNILIIISLDNFLKCQTEMIRKMLNGV